MLANTLTSLTALGSVAGAGAASAAHQPQMAGIVDEAATSFMMKSPAALEFAKESLPGNRLWKRYKAGNFAKLQRSLTDKSAKTPSKPAKIASGLISTGIALTPAVISGILVYQATGEATFATAFAVTATGGAITTGVGARDAIGIGVGVGVCAGGGVGVCAGGATSASAATAVGAGAVGGAGAVLLYPWLARFLDGPFSFVTRGREARQLDEVMMLLTNPTEIEHFFAQNPKEYLSFLKGSVSEIFRTKEAEARIRIDALRAKVGEAITKQNERLREIEASDISEADKEFLSVRVRTSTQGPIDKFNGAIGKEEAFVEQLNAFIEEISEMAVAIDREVAARNVYASVEQHETEMGALAETAARAEEARIQALIDLSAYWQRLREMGDNVLHLQEAHQEISRMLLSP